MRTKLMWINDEGSRRSTHKKGIDCEFDLGSLALLTCLNITYLGGDLRDDEKGSSNPRGHNERRAWKPFHRCLNTISTEFNTYHQ